MMEFRDAQEILRRLNGEVISNFPNGWGGILPNGTPFEGVNSDIVRSYAIVELISDQSFILQIERYLRDKFFTVERIEQGKYWFVDCEEAENGRAPIGIYNLVKLYFRNEGTVDNLFENHD